MDLLIATRNAGKIREIKALLAHRDFTVHGLDEFSGFGEVEEDGETFAANALKKARAAAAFSGMPALADDSGLCVAALQGRPGVHSARYAGEGASDAENIARLLMELAPYPAPWNAAFECVMAFCTRAFTSASSSFILRGPNAISSDTVSANSWYSGY